MNGKEMEGQKIVLEKKGAVCLLTINQPETLNALNTELLNELSRAFDDLEKEKDIYVVILTGAGRSFVAGADIAEMSRMNGQEAKRFGQLGAAVFRKVELSEKIVIAAVNGYALGGGCELAMACDLRIASTKAKFAQPEAGLGIIPGFSGTQRLPRLIGIGKAKELIYTTAVIDGTEAYRIGLVNRVVEPEKLMEECWNMAENMVSKAPIALRYAKEAINRGLETDIDTAIAVENNLFGLCFATADQKKGMRAFLNKERVKFDNQ